MEKDIYAVIITNFLKTIDEEDKFEALFAEFNKLSDSSKDKIAVSGRKLAIYCLTKIIEMEKKQKCKDHSFSNWEKFTTRRIVKKTNQFGESIPYNCRIDLWTRKCEKCGFEETTYEEPQELVEKRAKAIEENKKRLLAIAPIEAQKRQSYKGK